MSRSGKYDPQAIEAKWQKYWDEQQSFVTRIDHAKEKMYILDMFPYPSGAGLHVGHLEGYTATDILCRYWRMRGKNVLHPMGWDAFGLPAEQHAVETGTQPAVTTRKNIENFKRQIKRMGFSYDWTREINTTDPGYYKWTQWIFLKLFERGLAYQADAPVNWCPALGTVLANEEVLEGKSERGGFPVIRRPMRQWMLKITAYADRLLQDLDLLDWSAEIKAMQRNWIGRSEGAAAKFMLAADPAVVIEVFTTRPDTLFGATYMVLSPEHELLARLVTAGQREAVRQYQAAAARKSDLERTDLAREKTGVFTGALAINPVNGARIPIWIADYVLAGYGTGAIMAVPGHDQRDWDFATKFGLPIIEVVTGGDIKRCAYDGDGIMVNSGILDGLGVAAAQKKIIGWLDERKLGAAAVNYKLRDWLFSRQRYWGEPFPLLHRPDGVVVPLAENELPLILPLVDSYQASGDGESPLAKLQDWVAVSDPQTGRPLKRETNTMPQWAGSCWYYLRYLDPQNEKQLVAPEAEKYWMPVDLYLGGAEHAVLHLLYARFWHKVLYDLGVVHTAEPFQRLVNQGMILGEDNDKMSKSRGNVVNPDEVVERFGADTLRMYEMFMGPLERSKPWNTQGMEGVFRFLSRVWRCYVDDAGQLAHPAAAPEPPENVLRAYHKTVKKVTADLEALRFNTAISQMMIFMNEAARTPLPQPLLEGFALLLAPFCPHLGEELWELLGHDRPLTHGPWPAYDPELARDEELTIAIQVNGKLRGTVKAARGTDQEALKKLALAEPNVQKHLAGQTIKKVIVVPGRLVNVVVG